MPLPMQGNELPPGQQYVLRASFRARSPDRSGCNGAGNPVNHLPEPQRLQGGAQRAPVGWGVMGEEVDECALEEPGVFVAELEFRQLLEMVVQQRRMVDHQLKNERF